MTSDSAVNPSMSPPQLPGSSGLCPDPPFHPRSWLCLSVLQMVCERPDAFASACALARAFPLFTQRSGASRRTEKKTVIVEFFLVGQDNGPVEVSTLQVGVCTFRLSPAGRGTWMAAVTAAEATEAVSAPEPRAPSPSGRGGGGSLSSGFGSVQPVFCEHLGSAGRFHAVMLTGLPVCARATYCQT